MRQTQTVWVVCADPQFSSCIVNTVYLNREEAEETTKRLNADFDDFDPFWVERSQLII